MDSEPPEQHARINSKTMLWKERMTNYIKAARLVHFVSVHGVRLVCRKLCVTDRCFNTAVSEGQTCHVMLYESYQGHLATVAAQKVNAICGYWTLVVHKFRRWFTKFQFRSEDNCLADMARLRWPVQLITTFSKQMLRRVHGKQFRNKPQYSMWPIIPFTVIFRVLVMCRNWESGYPASWHRSRNTSVCTFAALYWFVTEGSVLDRMETGGEERVLYHNLISVES